MRKRTAALVVVLLLIFGIGISASTSYCADCNQADHACMEQQAQDLNDCCYLFGCDVNNPVANSYCYNRSEDVYKGCMVTKGCAPRNH